MQSCWIAFVGVPNKVSYSHSEINQSSFSVISLVWLSLWMAGLGRQFCLIPRHSKSWLHISNRYVVFFSFLTEIISCCTQIDNHSDFSINESCGNPISNFYQVQSLKMVSEKYWHWRKTVVIFTGEYGEQRKGCGHGWDTVEFSCWRNWFWRARHQWPA